MQSVTETWRIPPKLLISEAHSQACLVHIYPSGPNMGARYPLGHDGLSVGRDRECDICLLEPAVSRVHVRIQPGEDGFYALDLDSTNGTYVNDCPVKHCQLRDGDYLRVGLSIFRFLAGGNVEAEYHEEIYRLTIIDGLTGIPNKRNLLESLERELARSVRHKRPLALLMLDLDRFKAVNDQLGHLAGDYALRELVQCVKKTIRREELFARYGGEEFAIVLTETGTDDASSMAERIRARIENQRFCFEGQSFQVTVSIGGYVTCGEEGLTTEKLLRRADDNLYLAKNQGRNCAVISSGE